MIDERALNGPETIAVIGAIRTERERLNRVARSSGNMRVVESARRVSGTLSRIETRLLKTL